MVIIVFKILHWILVELNPATCHAFSLLNIISNNWRATIANGRFPLYFYMVFISVNSFRTTRPSRNIKLTLGHNRFLGVERIRTTLQILSRYSELILGSFQKAWDCCMIIFWIHKTHSWHPTTPMR